MSNTVGGGVFASCLGTKLRSCSPLDQEVTNFIAQADCRILHAMATDELVHLIDLSLGVEPQGVVNFNYLHGLLHGIVQRLVDIESVPRRPVTSYGTSRSAKTLPATLRGVKSLPNTAQRGAAQRGAARQPREGGVGGEGGTGGATREGGTDGATRDGRDRLDGEERGHLDGEEQDCLDGEDDREVLGSYAKSESGDTSGATSSSPRQESRVQMSTVSRPRLVTAANDMGALDRKLQDLELRLQTMETLPDMLDKMAMDPGATPVHDMWNFTKLDKRLNATEEGLGKVGVVCSCS